MEQKTTLIAIGDFFFKYRNFLFPALLIALFATSAPPHSYLGSDLIEDVVDGAALLLVALGLGLRSAVIGYRYIKRGGLNKKVYAENLVTDGFFAVCRNPLYVGNFLIYIGVLAKHGHPIVFVLGVAFFAFVYTAIVAAEEYFLRTNFCEAYVAYCKDVPRWRMNWSRLRAATEGMTFNFKRAIVKDYSTITNALVTLILLEVWEEVHYRTVTGEAVHWLAFCVLGAVIIAGALGIKVAKKRGVLTAS